MAPNIPGIVHRVVYEEPEPLSRFVPALPLEVERVLARAMAKDPAARYPTAEAFAEDAEDVLAGQPPRHVQGDDLVVVEESGTVRFRAGQPGAGSALPVLPAARGCADTRTSLPPPRRALAASPLAGGAARGGGDRLGLIASSLDPEVAPRPARTPRLRRSRSPAPGARSRRPRRRPHGQPARPGARGSTSTTRCAAASCGLRGRRADPRPAPERPGDEEGGRLHGARGHVPRRARRRAGAPRGADRGGVGRHTRVERIVGNFRSGVTRKLEASLGRYRRDLRLEWK